MEGRASASEETSQLNSGPTTYCCVTLGKLLDLSQSVFSFLRCFDYTSCSDNVDKMRCLKPRRSPGSWKLPVI